MTTRAATYSRYSSDQQRESSIVDQQRNCKRRADVERWKIVREFSDRAISGSDSSRPQYQEMLKAATRGEFEVLLVDDLSRLTRDSLEAEKTIRKLEFQGIRIVSISDGYDSTSKARKIQRGFKNLMNETFIDDLRERVHRGHEGQARRGYWNGGKPFGFRLKPVLDQSQRDAYGNPAQIGTKLAIDPMQAKIVKMIFERYVSGASCRAIAAELNERGVPSAGSTWRRKQYRSSGWMGSAIRVIVRNELYTGRVTWNRSKFVRDPSTEKIVRRARPRSEWVVNQNEDLRIVSDALFAKAKVRSQDRSNPDQKLKSGGKAKYLLSGLLKCGKCGAHYIFADARSYACSSYVNGGATACSNRARIRKDVLEQKILGPLTNELLSPDRVRRMAAELQNKFSARLTAASKRGTDAPRELAELEARLLRLRERLRNGGDPDMTDDELQAAIDRADAKRAELVASASTKSTVRVLNMLPRAAEIYRRQVVAGLDGHPEAAAKARLILRDLLGAIRIKPESDGSVWAEYEARPAALIRAADTDGRGDRI